MCPLRRLDKTVSVCPFVPPISIHDVKESMKLKDKVKEKRTISQGRTE